MSAALRRALAGLSLAGTLACSSVPPPTSPELSNVRLGPEYSQWLIGPIARLSTREEVDAFLGLADDAAAASFIEAYWGRRGEPVRRAFEARAGEADRRFTEAGYAGRRTDRGTIFVLYGEPREIRFESSRYVGLPPYEVWEYEPGVKSLDGRPVAKQYRFAKRDDLTVFYHPQTRRRPEKPVSDD